MKREMMAEAAAHEKMRKEHLVAEAQRAVDEWRQAMANMQPEELANMKRAMMAMDAQQAADKSYGNYGTYGKYTDYGSYPGDVEAETEKMQMA